MNDQKKRGDLVKEIETLKTELQERKLSLPAHSIRPHQLLVSEELQDKIRSLEDQVKLFETEKLTKVEK